MEITEQQVTDYFSVNLTDPGISAVVPIEPEFWMHPLLPLEDTAVHVPYGFRSPIEAEDFEVPVLNGPDNPDTYTLICPKIIVSSLREETQEVGEAYLDAWLSHLLYHLMLEPFLGDVEAQIDSLLYDECSPTLNVLSRVQMHQLDRLSTG